MNIRSEVVTFLRSHHVASLATTFEGAAHAACVMYAPQGVSLYWTSDPGSRHSQALERDPRVAATIAPDTADFRFIRGVQIAGRARRLGGEAEAAHARELLRQRFAFLRELDVLPAALRAAFDQAAFYRLDPETVTLIDNSKGFGSRQTLDLSASS